MSGHGGGHGHHHAFPVRLPFFEELKRRNLVRVAILYVVACYVILEPAHLVIALLELPPWVGRGVILIMSLGFPLVLLFSWIYEVTPEGIKPTAEVPPTESISRRTGQKLNTAIIVALSLAVLVLLANTLWPFKDLVHARGEHAEAAGAPGAGAEGAAQGEKAGATAAPTAAAPISDKSIAVLPFLDMSEKKDQEYFSDGLSEALIDSLAKIPDLRVAARTSCFYFKGRPENISDIARNLRVAHVLEGSVRKIGNTIRVTVQLIRADNGYHVWSQTYERQFSDIFKLQDDITGAVVKALKATLMADAGAVELPPSNPEAYKLLLQARFLIRRSSESEMVEAIRVLERSLKIDPAYAAAWEALADARWWMQSYVDRGSDEDLAAARTAAQRALEINPRTLGANLTLAHMAMQYNYDYQGALPALEAAERLAPRDPRTLEVRGTVEMHFGRLEAGMATWKAALDADPFNPSYLRRLSLAYSALGRYDEAENAIRRGLEVSPGLTGGYYTLARVLVHAGKADAAIAVARQERHSCFRNAALAMAQHAAGHEAEAQVALKDLMDRDAVGCAYQIGQVFALRGESENAFEWLQRAYRQHDTGFWAFPADRSFYPYHQDPRYLALLKRVGG